MASIIKREGKRGVSYRVQVFVKNAGTGKNEVITTTWRPPKETSEREATRLLNKFAVEFEEQCRRQAKLNNATDPNLTLAEYTQSWLDSIRQNRSASYFSSMRHHSKEICASIGQYKLKELNPMIIQRFVDKLKGRHFSAGYAVNKEFANLAKAQKITQVEMNRATGVSLNTIKSALVNKHIDIEKAKILCKFVGCKAEVGFDIVENQTKYCPSSIAKTLRSLRAILGTAKRQQFVEHNYASSDYITAIKQERHEVVCLDENQARIFANGLKAETDIRIKTSLMLILLTGIRRGEAAGLEWGDISLNAGEIKIKRSCVNVAGMGVVTGSTKSVASMREITMPDTLTDLVKRYRLWWEEKVKNLGDRYKGCDRVFLTDDGRRIHPCTFRYWLKKMTQKLNLPDINVHSLRHTNITLQILAGVPIKTVSVRAGHSTTKLTTDTYWQYFKSTDKEAAKTLDRIFG